MSILTGSKETFDQEVLQSALPVAVDFWAPWCGYCRMLAPILDQVAREYEGKLTIVKVNVDDEPDLAARYSIQTLPTLLLYQGGAAGEPLIAAKSKFQIEQWLAAQKVEK